MSVPSGSLTTLTTVKAELNISASTDDTYLERLIGVASNFVETYCHRTFAYSAAITEAVAGFGTPYLQLARPPISLITSITYDGATVDSSAYEIYSANGGLLYNETGWIHTGWDGPGITHHIQPGSERKLYSVVYKGGWVTPVQDGTGSPVLVRDMPYDLEDAVIQLVTYRYRMRGRDQTVASESLLNASVSYRSPFPTGESLKSILPNVYDILCGYVLEPIL